METADVASLAVNLVKALKDKTTTPENLSSREYASLRAEPEYASLVIHAAVTLEAPMAVVDTITKFLEIDQDHVLQLLPLSYLKANGDIPIIRKRYQTVMIEQTRTLTYDMISECIEGYTELAIHFHNEKDTSDMNSLWTQALAIGGYHQLEPFKMISVMISILGPHACQRIAEWAHNSEWNHHRDWIAIFELTQVIHIKRLVANLVAYDAISLEQLWGMKSDTTDEKLKKYEDKWRNENSNVQQTRNALSMAMPLGDSDDDEEGEEANAMEVDIETNSKSQTANGSESNSKVSVTKRKSQLSSDEDPDNFEVVTFLQKVVSLILTILSNHRNEKIEDKVIAIMRKYSIAFGTHVDVQTGASKLLARRLQSLDETEPEKSVSEKLGMVGDIVQIIHHAIRDPGWSAISSRIKQVSDLSERIDLFRKYMLPSIDAHPNKETLLFEFPTPARYMLYTDLYTRVKDENEFVKARFNSTERNTKDLLKRLTRNNAESEIVPQLRDQFCLCPWPSLNVFVNQVESYNIGKIVATVSATLKSDHSRKSKPIISATAMDMLPLVLMQQFNTAGRNTTQGDGLHVSKWLRLLAQFTGDIADGHDNFDYTILIKMVLHQFAQGNFSELFVMDQIIRRLCGAPMESNLSPVQIMGLNSGPIVAELSHKVISEQSTPQTARFTDRMASDEEGNLLQRTVLALSYAYEKTLLESEAKVLASKQDSITNLMLIFRTIDLGQGINIKQVVKKFWPLLTAGSTGDRPADFNTMTLFDVCFEPRIYSSTASIFSPKEIEKAMLGHKIRFKSAASKISAQETPNLETLLDRALLSPTDGLFVSRYIQLTQDHGHSSGLPLLGRTVLLSTLSTATPLEIESYSMLVNDYFTFILHQISEESTTAASLEELKEIQRIMTSTLLELAVPEAPYTVLNNIFGFMQRTLNLFPVFESDGNKLLTRIRLLTTTTKGDLETAVKSLYPQLTLRSKTWCTSDITPQWKSHLKSHEDRLFARFAAGLGLGK